MVAFDIIQDKNNKVENLNTSLKKKRKNCVSISKELQASHPHELCTCLFLLENIQIVRRMYPLQNEPFMMNHVLDKCIIYLSWSMEFLKRPCDLLCCGHYLNFFNGFLLQYPFTPRVYGIHIGWEFCCMVVIVHLSYVILLPFVCLLWFM